MKKKIVFLLVLLLSLNLYAHNFINILSTDNHTVFLSNNGKIFSCGLNLYGQLGIGYSSDYEKFSEIKCNAYFVSIAIGENHNLALDSNGFIWGWGSNECYQLSRNMKNDREILSIINSPVKLNNEKWSKIYASGNLSFGIKNDGTLWGWGGTNYVELGKWRNSVNEIKHPDNLKWKEIFLFEDYFVAVDSQDELWTWGSINKINSYSFFDFYTQNDSFYEVHKFDLQKSSDVKISKYNFIEVNNQINIYGYSVMKPSQIRKKFLIDIENNDLLSTNKDFFYKRIEKNVIDCIIYMGYFINQNEIFNKILNLKTNPSQRICYTLIKSEKGIILWTNGKRYNINNINIKNVWASNVIFLEDINNRIYIIGYNQNNRLGMNADDDQFLFLEPLNLQK